MRLCVSEWAWYVHWCTPCLNSVVRLWSSTLFGLLCLDVWLTEDLTNETKAVEDVLREEEGKGFCFCLVLEGFFVYVCAIETVQLEAAISFSCLTRAQCGQQGWIQECVFTLKIIFGFQNILCCRLFLVLSQTTDYLLVSCYSLMFNLFYFEEREVDCGGLQFVFSDLSWNHMFLIRFPSTVPFEFKNKMQASHETLPQFSTSNLFFSSVIPKREKQNGRQLGRSLLCFTTCLL